MDMQGEIRIPASRQAVWDALNDPEVLKECITGCQSLERVEDGGFEAVVKAKVGPVSATFKGAVQLENVNAPESYTIVGQGKGGAAGFAKGNADVSLEEDGEETILRYEVKAQVGGKMAQIGARLIDSTAKKFANEFFEKFSEKVKEANAQVEPGAGLEATSSEDETAPSDEPTDPIAEVEPPNTETASSRDETTAEAAPETDPKTEATKAAIEATDAVKANRGLSPFTWVLIIILLGLGASLIF